jgi:hypothetical protein|tara:strand:- start:2349 stop:3074 length:726 start_codon:yes stop_codon:yes gene_type:complete
MQSSSSEYRVPNIKLGRVSSTKEPALAALINKMAELIEISPMHREFVAGNGIKVTTDPTTTIIETTGPESRRLKFYPFKLFQKNSANDPTQVSVYYGTIDGNVPTISLGGKDIPLNDDISNTNPSLGLGVPYLETGSDAGEYLVYLEYAPEDPCATDDNPSPASVPKIKITTEPKEDIGDNSRGSEPWQMPNDTNTLGHVEIGRVTVEDLNDEMQITKIHQSVTHSLMHKSCGVRHFFWGV